MTTVAHRPARTTVRHGMASCAKYGCTRTECRLAYRRSRARQDSERARGITGRVDAAAATAHARKLQRAGMSRGDIATLSGIGMSTVGSILNGTCELIYRATQDAILGIPVPLVSRKRVAPKPVKRDQHQPGYIGITGSQKRLRALAALGFTRAYLGQRLGISARTIGDIRRGAQRRTRIEQHRAIAALYDELWNQHPEDHGINANTASRLRAFAERSGWKRPLELDDDLIDIPERAAARSANKPERRTPS